MRIAYVCADPGVPVFGAKGASIHAQGMLGAFLRAGAEVEVFAARMGGDPPADLAALVLHERSLPPTPGAAAREQALAAANGPLAGRLAQGGFDLVYERQALFAWAGMEAARAAGVPGVLEVNAPLVEEQALHRTLADRTGAEDGVRRALAAARVVVAVSRVLGRWLDRHPEAQGKVRVVPNAVDPRRFPAPPIAPVGRPLTVAFVGTLKPWHGLETLVDAFALLRRTVPGARLLVVGDGPGREDLEARVERARLGGAVELTGAVAPAAVGPLLRGADVSVVPYPPTAERYFSPLKAFEGMAAGLPVVGSRIGQLPEVVREGETGLLVAPGDVPALAAALAGLAADPEGRRRMGAAARAWVLRHHTWDGVAHEVLAAASAPVGAAA